jgi:hypothetical protein
MQAPVITSASEGAATQRKPMACGISTKENILHFPFDGEFAARFPQISPTHLATTKSETRKMSLIHSMTQRNEETNDSSDQTISETPGRFKGSVSARIKI